MTVVPVTTTLVDAELFRIPLKASRANGLRARSQAMVDKLTSVRRDRIGRRIGALAGSDVELLDAALRLWLAV